MTFLVEAYAFFYQLADSFAFLVLCGLIILVACLGKFGGGALASYILLRDMPAGVDPLGYYLPPYSYAVGQVLGQAIGAVRASHDVVSASVTDEKDRRYELVHRSDVVFHLAAAVGGIRASPRGGDRAAAEVNDFCRRLEADGRLRVQVVVDEAAGGAALPEHLRGLDDPRNDCRRFRDCKAVR